MTLESRDGIKLLGAFLDEVGLERPAELTPTMSLVDDLGLDSVLLLQLAHHCEDYIEAPPQAGDVPFFESVGELCDYIASRPSPHAGG
jgi:acyl carrier protein